MADQAAAVGPERSITLRDVAAALPDLTMGGVCAAFWIRLDWLTPALFTTLYIVVLFEIFVLLWMAQFAGVLTEWRRKAPGARGGVIQPTFLLFAGAGVVSALVQSALPLLTAVLQAGNRLVGMVLGQAPASRELALLRKTSGLALICWFTGFLATTLLQVPRFGTVAPSADMDGPFVVWNRDPQRLLAFGVLYFGAVGLMELLLPRTIEEPQPRERRRARV